jgi:endonuclease/exonuclease/phosphatase (EEP) superfamily protein YafD
LTIVALLAALASAAAPRFWIADLAVHFRLQCAALALAGCLTLAATGHALWALLVFAVAAIQALICAPLVKSRTAAAAPTNLPTSSALRLAAVNVWYRNHQFQRVVDFIVRERPDAVLFAEVTDEWQRALAPLAAEYAHRYATRGTRGTGLLLLSRWPMKAEILAGFSDVEPAVSATLHINDRSVQLLCVHTSWPLGPNNSALRDRQLVMVREFAHGQTQPLIVLGDLNVTPFSPHFQALLAGGKLKSAAQGFGWQPTWPTFLPPAGIQIDHALIGAGVCVKNFRRGSTVGSDHLPIIIDVVV